MPTRFDLVYIFVSVAFLCMSYQRGSYSAIAKVSALKHPDKEGKTNSCYCYDKKGRIYNLTPLKATVLNVQSNNGYQFSYNPCSAFKTGPAADECQSEDVAICRWVLNGGPRTHKVIGRQSLLKWRVNVKDKYMMYNTETGDFQNYWAKVMLNCDESKAKEADFELLNETDDGWTFQLTHLCACGNGCRPNPDTDADPMDIVIPVISSAATAVLLLVIFAIRGKRKNAGNNEERRHLLENGVGGRHVDEVHDPIQESLEELSRPAPIGSSHGKR